MIRTPSMPYFKGLDMINLQYEIRSCQKIKIKSQSPFMFGTNFNASDVIRQFGMVFFLENIALSHIRFY
jgi:hypothetical protein